MLLEYKTALQFLTDLAAQGHWCIVAISNTYSSFSVCMACNAGSLRIAITAQHRAPLAFLHSKLSVNILPAPALLNAQYVKFSAEAPNKKYFHIIVAGHKLVTFSKLLMKVVSSYLPYSEEYKNPPT